jgi:hypothetical protein
MKFDPKDVTIEKGWLGLGKGNSLRAVHGPTKTTVSRHVPVEVSLQVAMQELLQELKAALDKIENPI